MPNVAIDLALLADVKDHLGIPVATTTQDARLDRLISAASRKIMNWCDRRFVQETYTDYMHGRRSDTIILKHWPASKPTELNSDPSSIFAAATIIPTDEYDLIDDSLVVLLNGRKFQRGTRNIKVVYEAGYATIPEDLEEGCIHQVEYTFNLTSDRRIGQITKSKSGESVTYIEDGMPKIVIDAIMPYKRVEFANSNAAIDNG